jgi:outer membrane protein assembly factor BamB
MTYTVEDHHVRRSLRLWPGVLAVALQWLLRFVVPAVVPGAGIFGVIASLVLGLVVLIWWAFFSRAPRAERWGGAALLVLVMIATPSILHPSMAKGMMGMLFAIYAIPVLSLAFVLWAIASRRLPNGLRWASMVATILVACAAWALLRTDGITGEGSSQFAWRWSETPEQRLLSKAIGEPSEPPAASAETPTPLEQPTVATTSKEPSAPPVPIAEAQAPVSAEWPGFRGPKRDGVVHGTRIKTDWSISPPVELWRRPIGPGWSSFAVNGDLLYTQEQRGEEELVACYRLTSGRPVWTHRDRVRFWESNAGAGPRGTPTLSSGRVYSVGATGIVNALDAKTGATRWSRNAASDTDTAIPDWGFSSSPLVSHDVVIVAASGKLVAYDIKDGEPRWSSESGGGSYSSPHLVTIGGVEQVLLLSGAGVTSFSPSDGKRLWQHAWKGASILQPALTPDGDVLITTGDASGGQGIRRIKVAGGNGRWHVEERWTSAGLKPYFNDYVIHKSHAFGFDGRILAAIDLMDGKRSWKGGRYGHGQLVLLPDQDLLLVLSEEGELALVKATPDQFTEVARFQGLEGKTWNHPVLVGDVLLARNGEEMAAFRLPHE